MKIYAFLLAAVLLPAIPAPAAPAPRSVVLLRYKFHPGQTLAYQLIVNGRGTVSTGEAASFPVNQDLSAVLRMTVQRVRASDGAATVQIRYDAIRMTVNGQPMAPQDTAQILPPAVAVMTPTGRLLSYKSSPTMAPATEGMPTGDLFVLQAEGAFPATPIAVGQRWQESAAMATMGLGLSASNTLSGIAKTGGDTVAYYTTTLGGTFDPSGQAAAPAALQAGLSGTMIGTLSEVFDLTVGATQSETGQFQFETTMTSTALADAGFAVGLQMQMQTQMTVLPTLSRP